MSEQKQPTIIKKYANRRLYHTGTSVYVTLEDLAKLVKAGEEFVVQDAKTGEDITRGVLGQIIFEQEGKEGQNLLPTDFLRQLIKFYGDSMQGLVPQYLTFSIERLVGEQQKFRDQISKALGPAFPAQAIDALDSQARGNMAMFQNALKMFNPFSILSGGIAQPAPPAAKPQGSDVDAMRRELDAMKERLDKLSKGG